MKRKISIALCGALLLGMMAGCGGSQASSGESAGGSPIKIGYFGPLTGGSAQLGQAALNGAQLAVDFLDAVNQAGVWVFPGVGVVKPLDVGEDHQQVGPAAGLETADIPPADGQSGAVEAA